MEYMKRCEIDKENARLRERFGEDCTEQEEWEKNVIEPYKADGDAESPRNIEGLNWQDSAELPPEPLSEDQKYILGLVLEGHNVFFTGPAGSGKSLLLKHIKYHLRKNKKRYDITAPTGVAAVLINGRTIHSWSGLGKGDKGLNDYITKALREIRMISDESGESTFKPSKKNKNLGSRSVVGVWREIDVLIIDEVSMVP
ncbi:hypothetical protein P167DRAFT_98833 [Morchella conica CCBAS932]|uniref:ATP-dependent DNA helicase n=1 Tax=Morchella conica CCBAS932 TaxID=1392247 RepID=A0A3N4KTE5_9PEZI|nr:hypothetical protein P167DRAFT_98833 [Morchella conica CCBAS932]